MTQGALDTTVDRVSSCGCLGSAETAAQTVLTYDAHLKDLHGCVLAGPEKMY